MRASSRAMLLMGEPTGDLGAFTHSGDRKIRLYDSGGGGSAPSSQTVTQTSIPAYAQPYVENMLGQAYALTDMSNVANQYPTYSGERTAQFTPLQQQAFSGAAALAPSAQNMTAANFAALAGERALGTGYTPTQYQNQYVAPATSMSAPANFAGATLGAAPRAQAATTGPAPTAKAASFTGPGAIGTQNVQAGTVQAPNLRDFYMQAAQSDYDPAAALQQYQMGQAERVGTEKFIEPGTAEAYMSPYIQRVLDTQRREAVRAEDIERQKRGARAVAAGAFGGSRQAIEEAEANRNLQTRLGDIEAAGLQKAYETAQQQFTSDQARALQAAQANQGAGLTVGGQNLAAQLGVQQLGANLGAQFGLANLSNEQQAALQNLAAQLGVQQLGAQTGLTAQQLNQQAGMQAALANQQAGLQAGQFNAQTAYNTALQNAQMQQQAALANQQLAGQYGLTGAQLANQMALQNAQLGTQANIAGAQLAGQYGLTGAQLAQQAALANQQYGLQAQQLQEQANQFGANYGLQQAGIGMNAASQLGNLGYTQFQQNLGALNAQNLIGGQQQQQAQNILGQQYQDFLTQQQYPMQQLQQASAIYRGYPGQTTTATTQYAPPSLAQTAMGIGTGLIGINKMFGAEGGQVKAPRSSGLADLLLSKLD